MWHANDSYVGTAGTVAVGDSAAQRRQLNHQEDKLDHRMGWGVFFPGCEYVFVDSEAPGMGRVRSGLATGVKLILDHREPEDTGDGPVRILVWHPVAMAQAPPSSACPAPTRTPCPGAV